MRCSVIGLWDPLTTEVYCKSSCYTLSIYYHFICQFYLNKMEKKAEKKKKPYRLQTTNIPETVTKRL